MSVEPSPQSGFEPAELMIIDDLETLKVLADPLRLRIMELMREVTTVKQVAAELDMPPTKLYYHINLMEKHGLIVMVDTRIVSGIIEKHYQVAAKMMRVSGALLSPAAGDEGLAITLSGVFEDLRSDILQSIRDGVALAEDDAQPGRGIVMVSNILHLNETQAAEFYERLGELLKEYETLSQSQRNQPDAHRYKTLQLIFPSSRVRRSESE